MISPLLFFLILLTGTVALLVVYVMRLKVQRRRLVALAREWRMHYARDDRFNLAPRVAERLSLPGAADICISNLIYGSEQGTRRYVFAAEYTRGVVRAKRREWCVASIAETNEVWSDLKVAPKSGSIVEQYKAASGTS